ncbi:MAG: hypothetical protein SWK90_06930 [Chloroflexota bacterium]|nr:hypothetical protein [Chloroflexota bacterium]
MRCGGWLSSGWHDRFDFPAVALTLLGSFVVIYPVLRVLPGPVRVIHTGH